MRTCLAFLVSIVWLAGCGGSTGSDLFGPGGTSGGSSSSSSGGSSSGDIGTCGAVPRCDEGDTEVPSEAACPGGSDSYCYSRALCGQTIWCSGQEACRAIPVCPAGFYEVPNCAPPHTSCKPVTVCRTTILCREGCQAAPPQCDPGDVEVPSSIDCNGAKCYSRSNLCGLEVWCTKP